jgi:hypothetical protein
MNSSDLEIQKLLNDTSVPENKESLKNTPLNVKKEQDYNQYLFDKNDSEDYMHKVRTNTLEQGEKTGIPPLDDHFRFKQGNLVICHGIDNVGKSSVLWYLMMLANVNCGWKPLLYCTENREPQVAKSIMQFRCGKKLTDLTQIQYNSLKDWFWSSFGIIKTDEDMDILRFLDICNNLCAKHGYNAVLGDPYNAYAVPSNANDHKYHLECANNIKKFNRETKVTTFFNCHPNTNAYRNIHKEGKFKGHIKPPNKGDVDGGAKFPSKADDYMTIHRYTEHATEWRDTAISIRKIKDTETGGKVTPMNKPILIRMNPNGCGFLYDQYQIGLEDDDKSSQKFIDPMAGKLFFDEIKGEQLESKPIVKPKQKKQEQYHQNNVFKGYEISDEWMSGDKKKNDTDWSNGLNDDELTF